MKQIEGRSGELVDRLIRILNSDALGEGQWYDVSLFASSAVGGRALNGVVPDTGPPVPGSVGEEMRQRYDVVSRERYFELLRERLGQLVAYGVEEAFLVRSIRDTVRRYLESFADFEVGDRKRAVDRTRIERIAEDPVAIAEFRAALVEQQPSAASRSDDEIAADLRSMAERLRPTSPENAIKMWELLTNWDQQAASILPDVIFEEWSFRRSLRRWTS